MKKILLRSALWTLKGLLGSVLTASVTIYVLKGVVPFGSDQSNQVFWNIVRMGAIVTAAVTVANIACDFRRWHKDREEHRRIAKELGVKM